LTALDSIFFHEECITEMTLTVESDNETESHQLIMVADNNQDAERWICAFQQSISELNRLTVITEEEGGERSTSEKTGQPIPGVRPATERLDVNWGKGSKKNVHDGDGNNNNNNSSGGTLRAQNHPSNASTNSSSSKMSSNVSGLKGDDASGEYISRKKKREKLAELFKADENR